jgi:hypothetical protein
MKHHVATYVTVPKDAGHEVLLEEAAKRLGGTDGIDAVSIHYTDEQLCGTFTRDWETPDPAPVRVTHTPSEGVEKE